jgi:hypothetical protein
VVHVTSIYCHLWWFKRHKVAKAKLAFKLREAPRNLNKQNPDDKLKPQLKLASTRIQNSEREREREGEGSHAD